MYVMLRQSCIRNAVDEYLSNLIGTIKVLYDADLKIRYVSIDNVSSYLMIGRLVLPSTR